MNKKQGYAHLAFSRYYHPSAEHQTPVSIGFIYLHKGKNWRIISSVTPSSLARLMRLHYKLIVSCDYNDDWWYGHDSKNPLITESAIFVFAGPPDPPI